jgi:hypothetical protein
MLLPIAGTLHKTKYLGRVVDRCARCGDLQPFGVRETYAVEHFSCIPLGREKLIQSTRRCLTCNTRVSCNSDAYSAILTDREALGYSIEDLLRITNGELFRRRQQDQLWKECLSRPLDGNDAIPRLALDRLREMSADGPVSQFLDRLLAWHDLPLSDRYQLLRQIDAHVKHDEMRARASDVVTMVAQNAPQGAGCAPAMVICALLGIVLFFLTCLTLSILEISHNVGSAFLCVLVVTVVLGLVAYWKLRQAAYRRLFTDRLIEPVEAGAIDVGLVLGTLNRLPLRKGISSEVRTMLRFRPLLIELLRARGMISSTLDNEPDN